MNLLFQLRAIWGIDVIRIKRVDDLYKAFTNTPSISATHLIDLYGVKYITSVTPIEDKNKFELIYARLENLQGNREYLLKENTIKLYKNHSPLPRAWLVKDYKVMDSNAMLARMTNKDFRPDREVLLEEKPKWANLPIPPLQKGGEGGINKGRVSGREPYSRLPQKVQFVSENNNRLALQAEVVEDSLLVLSDTYYPGWKVFVNGERVKIYRADYAFRAIPLSPGTHRIEFIYDPLSFKLGALFTILGIIGCAAIYLSKKNR